MKRFASHYLLVPEVGFLKQHVVEIDDAGKIQRIFPLTGEVESVEWFPGIIALLSRDEIDTLKNNGMLFDNIPLFAYNHPVFGEPSSPCLLEVFAMIKAKGEPLFPYLFYPFDFISMQPVGGTRHRPLR